MSNDECRLANDYCYCCVPEVHAKTPGGQVIYCAGPMNYAVAVCSDI